ncbi:MAG: hypothetical protein NVS1B9_03870 [Solirubrobacteraceae bacterium]
MGLMRLVLGLMRLGLGLMIVISWSAIGAVALALFLAFGGTVTAVTPSGSCHGASLPLGSPPAQERAAILCLVNVERSFRALRPLVQNPALTRAAQAHTREMVQRNYISHVGARGSSPLSRVRWSGYLRHRRRFTWAENIGWGDASYATPESIVERWMSSAVHRRDILNATYRDSGIGFVARTPRVFGAQGVGVIVTQDFGSRR